MAMMPSLKLPNSKKAVAPQSAQLVGRGNASPAAVSKESSNEFSSLLAKLQNKNNTGSHAGNDQRELKNIFENENGQASIAKRQVSSDKSMTGVPSKQLGEEVAIDEQENSQLLNRLRSSKKEQQAFATQPSLNSGKGRSEIAPFPTKHSKDLSPEHSLSSQRRGVDQQPEQVVSFKQRPIPTEFRHDIRQPENSEALKRTSQRQDLTTKISSQQGPMPASKVKSEKVIQEESFFDASGVNAARNDFSKTNLTAVQDGRTSFFPKNSEKREALRPAQRHLNLYSENIDSNSSMIKRPRFEEEHQHISQMSKRDHDHSSRQEMLMNGKGEEKVVRMSDFMRTHDSAQMSDNKEVRVPNKILDLSKFNASNPSELINKISDYIQQYGLMNMKEVGLTVRHAELGEFRINVSSVDHGRNIDLAIMTNSEGAQNFFNKNESMMLRALADVGVNVSDFKVGSGSMIDSKMMSDFSNQSSDKTMNENFSADQRRNHGGSSFENDGSRKRRELWEEAKERMGA